MINNIFDSHAHYHDKKFDKNRDILLKSLPQNGIDKVINVGTNIEDSQKSLELVKKYDYMFASVGVHPYDIETLSNKYIDELEVLTKDKKVIAIGEIGLDYYNNEIDRQLQQKIFKEQLSLATEIKKPVIIHMREADKDTVEILKQYKLKGVVHCFSGHAEIAKILIEMGYYLGFTGVITFKNNNKQTKTLYEIPIEKVLIETDCPYMAPEPYRGQICNSTMLPSVIEKISNIKNIAKQKVADITNINACNLFEI